MTKSGAIHPVGYRAANPTHWFWHEDVPRGLEALTCEDCERLGIAPHEGRLAGNDRPAVLFSGAYYFLDRVSAPARNR
jgi:hypothetical protein